MPRKHIIELNFSDFRLNSITWTFITIFLDEIEMGIIFPNGTHGFNKWTKSSHKKKPNMMNYSCWKPSTMCGKKKITQSNG
jgi:hypothetical protein